VVNSGQSLVNVVKERPLSLIILKNLFGLTSDVGDNTKDNFQFEKLPTAVFGFLWQHSHETKMALLSKLYSENMWTPGPATPD
jgi:hypothetical protein